MQPKGSLHRKLSQYKNLGGFLKKEIEKLIKFKGPRLPMKKHLYSHKARIPKFSEQFIALSCSTISSKYYILHSLESLCMEDEATKSIPITSWSMSQRKLKLINIEYFIYFKLPYLTCRNSSDYTMLRFYIFLLPSGRYPDCCYLDLLSLIRLLWK